MKMPKLDDLLIGNHFIGIEHFTYNNENKVSIVVVKKKKEGLIIEKENAFNSDVIAKERDKSFPYFLVVNSNQVIQKEILSIDSNDEKIINKAFPNTNWNEFYYEIWRLKTKSIIAITRKNYLDDLIKEYNSQKTKIIGISLGSCAIADIYNYTSFDNLYTNTHIIAKNEQDSIISNIKELHSTISYEINNLKISNVQLLAFSGIIRLVSNFTENSGSIIDLSNHSRNEYIQKQFFLKFSKRMLWGLLALLLINFVCFSHYYKASQEASEKIAINKVNLQNLVSLKQRIKSKESIVQNVLKKKESQSSFYCNEIAQIVPSSIQLTELEYNPLEKKIKNEESIIFIDKTILINGVCKDNTSFTSWIDAIETKNWTSKVVITHFGKNKNNETEFGIKINLK